MNIILLTSIQVYKYSRLLMITITNIRVSCRDKRIKKRYKDDVSSSDVSPSDISPFVPQVHLFFHTIMKLAI